MAVYKVMNFAITQLAIKECIASHAIENQASERVIQKIEFHFKKEIPYECNGGDISTTATLYKFVAKYFSSINRNN